MNEWRKVHSPDVGWVIRCDDADTPDYNDGVVAYCMSSEENADIILQEHELAQSHSKGMAILAGEIREARARIAELEGLLKDVEWTKVHS